MEDLQSSVGAGKDTKRACLVVCRLLNRKHVQWSESEHQETYGWASFLSMYLYGVAFLLINLIVPFIKARNKPPHIIIIVIDDLGMSDVYNNCNIQSVIILGWNDVPWNNPDSWAVNLGKYARLVIL